MGDAEKCVAFDNIQVSCTAGVCKNISEVYKCEFQNRLTDIENDWANGYCHCNFCSDPSASYPGECPETTSKCNRERPFNFYGNETVKQFCEHVPCATCQAVNSIFHPFFSLHLICIWFIFGQYDIL